MPSFKAGDIFLSTSRSKNGSNSSLFQYDRTSLALLGQWSDGAGTEDGHDGAFMSPWGHLWVLHFNRKAMEAWSPTGAVLWTKSMEAKPESVLFDRLGYAFVGQVDLGRLDKFQLDGTFVASFSPTVEDRGIDHIDLAPDGQTMVYTSEGPTVMRWNLKTATQGPTFATLPEPLFYSYGLKRTPYDGSYLVAVDDGINGRVDRLTSIGAFVQSYTFGSTYWSFFGIDIDLDPQFFWLGVKRISDARGMALKVNLLNGAVVSTIDTGVTVASLDSVVVNVIRTKIPMLRVS